MERFTIKQLKNLAKGMLARYIAVIFYLLLGLFFLMEYRQGIVVTYAITIISFIIMVVYETKFVWGVLREQRKE